MKKHPFPSKQKGAALVLILGSLILLSILVVAFLLNVRNDMNSSAFYAGGASNRQLAEMANNLVIAQLTDATANADETWISQPGLVRTYNSAGAVAAYKLYSSDVMKVEGDFNPLQTTVRDKETPSNWHAPNRADEFVDLNKPVFVHTGTAFSGTIYPIVDPTAADKNNPALPVTGTNASWDAEGFSYDNSDVRDSSGVNSSNPLPMPVRWIYVLADGSMATWNEISSNPGKKPVGRIAFWADDETSKVNINTASEGVFYEAPAYFTTQDYFYGITQPVAQEYQRYPGHPATTALSAVLKPLREMPENQLNAPPFATVAIRGPALRSVAAATITPRISAFNSNGLLGGSKGGIDQAWIQKNPIALDSDRLYTSVDELVFGPRINGTQITWNSSGSSRYLLNDSFNSVATISGGSLPTAPIGALNITPELVAKSRFFLTANSRAPELNVFNRPRVTLWPFNKDSIDGNISLTLTPEDRLIKFTSEIGDNHRKLYFQRLNAWSIKDDWDEIQDNQNLYTYLQRVSGMSPPNSGGATFAQKYTPLGRDQILTEMWDYIRSNINTYNFAYQPVTGVATNSPMTYSFPQNKQPLPNGEWTSGYNDIIPLIIDTNNGRTKGMGSSIVLPEIIFQFYNAGEYLEGQNFKATPGDYGLVTGTANDNYDNTQIVASGSLTSGTSDDIPDYIIRRVQLVCLFNPYTLTHNLAGNNMRYQVKISGTPFGIRSTDSRITMRCPALGVNSWVSQINNIGFPNGGSTLVCAQGGDDEGSWEGAYGIGWPLMFPIGNTMTNPRNESILKAFTRTLDPSVKTSSGILAANNLSGDMTYRTYPFISEVIEFRFPHPDRTPNYNKVPPPNATPVPPYLRTYGESGSTEKEPGVEFIGANDFTIEIFPGLKNDSGTYKEDFRPASIDIPLHVTSTTQTIPLMSTEIEINNRTMPLPRLAQRDLVFFMNQNPLTNYPVRNTYRPPVPPDSSRTYFAVNEMQYYPMRMRMSWDRGNFVMVPRKNNVYRATITASGTNEVASFSIEPPPTSDRVNTGPMDVLFSYHLSGTSQSYGDLRLAAFRNRIPKDWWTETKVPTNWYRPASDTTYETQTGWKLADFMSTTMIFPGPQEDMAKAWYEDNGPLKRLAAFISGGSFSDQTRIASGSTDGAFRKAYGSNSVSTSGTAVGDFTMGFGSYTGGAGVLGPDIGSAVAAANSLQSGDVGPYYTAGPSRSGLNDSSSSAGYNQYHFNAQGISFSPFKQMPSAVMFGTLPSRVLEEPPAPWETLLFSPQVETTTHRGWREAPRDHYWLDLFYMPVVEPYAITENLATAGKINLNYQIAPFTYIQRKTGMYAVLRNMQISAVPNNQSSVVKNNSKYAKYNAASATNQYRYRLDVPETLSGFDARFTANKPFVSASEVTEMFLVPQGQTLATMPAFWQNKELTGDDRKESPYNHIYPRVTTRSNTFQVHYWVQSLKSQNINGQTKVNVTGEYRGSSIVERYLDLNNEQYGSINNSGSADDLFPPLSGNFTASDGTVRPYYKYRTINSKQFAP